MPLLRARRRHRRRSRQSSRILRASSFHRHVSRARVQSRRPLPPSDVIDQSTTMNQSINRSHPVCPVDPRRDAPRSEPPHRGLERARSHRGRRHPCSLRVTSVRGQHPSIHPSTTRQPPRRPTTDDRSLVRSTDRPRNGRASMDVTSSIVFLYVRMIGYSMHRRLGDMPSIHPSRWAPTPCVVSRES